MKAKLASSGFRIAVVIATLMGWLVLSNHCVLAGLMEPAPVDKPHQCCQQTLPPDDEAPATGKPMQCCKALRVLLPDGAKAPDYNGPLLVVLPLIWEICRHLAELQPRTPAIDTGPPPDSPSFAELVLHRSMQSHAPPAA